MQKRKKYIAYGSNLNLAQMARRCPTAKVVGKGEIKDYELLFRGCRESAVATVEPKKGASVPVLIWDIGPEDERNLDIYEGYPRLYGKVDLEVQTEDGCESIMAYTMNEGHEIGKPSVHYLETIANGYLEAGFDLNGLLNSVSHCKKLMEQEMECLLKINPSMEFVIYTLDFVVAASMPEICRKFGIRDPEIIQIAVSKLTSKNTYSSQPAPWIITGKAGE